MISKQKNKIFNSRNLGTIEYLLHKIAVIMILFSLIAIGILHHVAINHNLYAVFFMEKIYLELLYISMVVYFWLFMRDVFTDYIHSTGLKLILYSLSIMLLLITFIYITKILF